MEEAFFKKTILKNPLSYDPICIVAIYSYYGKNLPNIEINIFLFLNHLTCCHKKILLFFSGPCKIGPLPGHTILLLSQVEQICFFSINSGS
jgi:hypothetical protein